MPNHHAFADNVRDLSDSNGYQFEVVCERCGSGYPSPLVHDKIDLGRTLFRVLGDVAQGPAPQLALAAVPDRRHGEGRGETGGAAARHRAMERAVQMVREEFRQCRGCGDRVCDDVCWSHETAQCLACSRS